VNVGGSSGSISYDRGHTKLQTYDNNEFAGDGALNSHQGPGQYKEPLVDVLANSRRA